MGSRGPRPTPTPILKLRGSKRALYESEQTEGPPGRPRAPSTLDADARRTWNQLIPMLEQMGVLSKIDGKQLARYCDLSAWWARTREFVRKHGETYPLKADDGSIKYIATIPHVGLCLKLHDRLVRMEQEFGMTPSARSRIVANPTIETIDPFTDYMERGRQGRRELPPLAELSGRAPQDEDV